jgi:hypothetical protein
MKTLYKIFPVLAAILLLNACDDSFLEEKQEVSSNQFLQGSSSIIISPYWEETEFIIYCYEAQNAEFSVVETPDWLEVKPVSGSFDRYGETVVRCKASVLNDFSDYGVYEYPYCIILQTKNGQVIRVSAAYLVEGSPTLSAEIRYGFSNEWDDLTNMSYNCFAQVTISNNGDGVLVWEVAEKSDWIKCVTTYSSSPVVYKNSSAQLSLAIDPAATIPNDLSGFITLRSKGNKTLEVTLSVSLTESGSPQLTLYDTAPIDFGKNSNSISFAFYNYGDGYLIWSFDNLPEWLAVSPQSGILQSLRTQEVFFVCDRSKAPEGKSNAEIVLKTNDKNHPETKITVSISNRTGNGDNIFDIQGTVTDAAFDKNRDLLYITTAQPNQLLVFNAATKSQDYSIELNKAPSCLSLTENGQIAAVGHNGLISIIDLTNTLQQSFTVSIPIFDIEWADDNYICFSESDLNDVQWTKLRWLNLTTGSVESDEALIYQNCAIKKTPAKNYIIASETQVSSGLYTYDINEKKQKNQVFQETGNLWFFKNGDYFLSSYGKIFDTESLTKLEGYDYNYSAFDQLRNGLTNIISADYCTATDRLWVLPRNDYSMSTAQFAAKIETNDFYSEKQYVLDDIYVRDGKEYNVGGYYIFVNSSGSEVFVLKNQINYRWDSDFNNVWSIEYFNAL